ncbi:MAG: AAA family ATPase [Lachnospiraceae bacterium]|nr:AAA family ATPase [Lachnospiraceae bacterium]
MYHLNVSSPIINYQKTLKRKIYVDKSLLIKPLNDLIGTDECYVCITRPRRFGKTINANMLGAYYTRGYDSRELFCGLAISKEKTYLQHLNQHNVIYIDFSRMPDLCLSYQDYITNILTELRNDLAETYPALRGKEYSMISRMLLDTGDSFIFILDEWDSVFHEEFMHDKEKQLYLKFLKGLLKDQPYVELAYMTGVLPIAKYSSGSELNMFREYHFMNDHVYEAYFGLSEAEVQKLCREHTRVSFQELKRWGLPELLDRNRTNE